MYEIGKQDSPLSPCPCAPWRRGPCPLHRLSKEVYPPARVAPSPRHRPSGGRWRTNYSHAHANHHSLPAFPVSSAAGTPRRSSPEIRSQIVSRLEIVGWRFSCTYGTRVSSRVRWRLRLMNEMERYFALCNRLTCCAPCSRIEFYYSRCRN